jgi:hypothetical protein
MRYFCTYFDSGFFVKGLALYQSLVRFASPFRLWVLCFDDFTYKTLQDLKLVEVVPISLKDFETGDEKLLQAKANRSRIEYYFTCTPSLPLYVLKNYPQVDLITYVDADLFFFSDLSPIYEELGNNSILIIGHRFSPRLKRLEVYGFYNVGFLSFRRDNMGLQCLHWWRKHCIEWCYDRVKDGRFADQKYLDDWPTSFSDVVVLQHKGANLAPWNVANYSLELEKGKVLIDSEPLVFFHFHGFKKIGRLLYDPNLASYGVPSNSMIKRHIYNPYLRELRSINRWLSRFIGQSNIQMGSIRGTKPEPAASDGFFRRIVSKIKYQHDITKKVLQGDLWMAIRGRVV